MRNTVLLVSPYYVINFDPDLATKHEPLVDVDRWVGVNVRLIDELGADAWLRRRLAVLQGSYPRDDADLVVVDDAA